MSERTIRFTSLEPMSRVFGFDRGTPIDRYYIERFLARRGELIRGRVLEVGDAAYTRRFGGSRVARSDVLHVSPENRKATLIGDIESGDGVPRETFDCIILTQVLPFVFDVRGAMATCFAALKPGGVLLATAPGISQISRYDMDRWGDFWRFTSLSLTRLAELAFGPGSFEVESHGNVAAATAFLLGFSMEELTPGQLDHHDRDYELILTLAAHRGPR